MHLHVYVPMMHLSEYNLNFYNKLLAVAGPHSSDDSVEATYLLIVTGHRLVIIGMTIHWESTIVWCLRSVKVN